MIRPGPEGAPPRHDLPYLRRRSRSRLPRPATAAGGGTAPDTRQALADFISSRGPHPRHGVGPATPPAADSSLDLSAPATPPATPAPPRPAADSSLDLSTPSAPPPPPAADT
ncbi:MAG: hypothetical protein ACJ73S_15310, partial [Mycobacteriales bacterium]